MDNKKAVLRGVVSVTNKEFLTTLFGDEWDRAHITSFPDDPNDITIDRRAICWAGGLAKSELASMGKADNQYFTISLFNFDEKKGKARRAKDLFDACFVIVADDVREKLPVEMVEKLPLPTYKMHSSSGSEQWGWVLSEPCESRDMVDNLLDGLVAKGLAPTGRDPGMKGVTRYVRLPEGVNSKSSRLVDGAPFQCYISEWNPLLNYPIESLAAVFDIDLSAGRHNMVVDAADESSPLVLGHPLWPHLTVTGYGDDGWVRVDCPNADKHSSADASGGAFRIAEDGHVEYQCHHGACNGDASTGKLTGPRMMKLVSKQVGLDMTELSRLHVEGVQVAGVKAMLEAGVINNSVGLLGSAVSGKAVLSGGRDPAIGGIWEDDIIDYVYMAARHEFYNLRSGVLIPAKGLDSLYLSECTGAKGGLPLASRQFLMAMDKEHSVADGLGWMPTNGDRPSRDEVIFSSEGRRLVNTWKGFALTPVSGDVSVWLEHAEYLFPDAFERGVVIKYLAAVLQRLGEKPAFTILNRGTLRNGKDSFFEPMMKIFGSAAGAANVEDVASGWGDYVFGMKFMIMHEANMGQRKDTANNLKIIIAPSANGVRMLNIKGKGLVTQADVTAYLIMTNHRDAIAIESGDMRYFVADSWVPPQSAAYYARLRGWLENESGFAKVMNYLLGLDVSGFSLRELPKVTGGAREMMQSGKYDYEQDMEEMINAGEFPFNTPFTLKTLKAVLRDSGHNRVGNNGIEAALRSNGFMKYRGAIKVDGVTKATPHFYSNVLPLEATGRESYDEYFDFHNG
tara:strand:+ start:2511 stop:4889 length:2379 start_codon:yes stop_codon:yes gene_type:complete